MQLFGQGNYSRIHKNLLSLWRRQSNKVSEKNTSEKTDKARKILSDECLDFLLLK